MTMLLTIIGGGLGGCPKTRFLLRVAPDALLGGTQFCRATLGKKRKLVAHTGVSGAGAGLRKRYFRPLTMVLRQFRMKGPEISFWPLILGDDPSHS